MGARVLVVEDNPANLELMMYLLKALGHEPVSATDGSDGLLAARTSMPDLVICDLQLPRINGYDFARNMKSDTQLAGIPLIAVTAFAMPGDREKALAAGFDGYISKPIAPEHFLRQICELLAQRGGEVNRASAERAHEPPRATLLVIGATLTARRRLRSVLEPRGLELLFTESIASAGEDGAFGQVDLVLIEGAADQKAIASLSPSVREIIVDRLPLQPDELVSVVESALAGRMRVT